MRYKLYCLGRIFLQKCSLPLKMNQNSPYLTVLILVNLKRRKIVNFLNFLDLATSYCPEQICLPPSAYFLYLTDCTLNSCVILSTCFPRVWTCLSLQHMIWFSLRSISSNDKGCNWLIAAKYFASVLSFCKPHISSRLPEIANPIQSESWSGLSTLINLPPNPGWCFSISACHC